MAYKVISPAGIYTQLTIIDFIIGMSLEIIDTTTQKGKKRLKEISKPRVSIHKNQQPSINSSTSKAQDIKFISKNVLNERSRRIFAGFLARSIGQGGNQKAARLTGLDVKTIRKGKKELVNREQIQKGRIRREGGGRLSKAQGEPRYEQELQNIIEDDLAGDPMSERKWVRKTLRWMKKKLHGRGINAAISTIWKSLKKLNISLKKNLKFTGTQSHPMRDTQFRYLNKLKHLCLKLGIPVISVDTKKKENIGNFKNDGRTWRKEAYKVLDHDFPSLAMGKLIPFGIYDLKNNKGQVYCGTTRETSEFAVDCICKWWEEHGKITFPNQSELLILCDSGGANGYRRRMWKWKLQTQLADRLGLTVFVCHYPPGASKYNPIEHKMFSFITKNWSGEPLTSYSKALSLIKTTKTEKALEVGASLNEKKYEKGIKVSDKQIKSLRIKHAKICPQWNYYIRPR